MRNFCRFLCRRSLLSDARGAVSIMFGLMLVLLLILIGGVLDFGSAMVSRTQAQGATDATALAVAQPPGGIDPNVAGKRYFDVNYPFNTANIARPYGRVGVNNQPDQVTVTSNENLNTSFLQLGGIETVAANAITVVSKQSVAVPPDTDVVMVVDSSASMYCTSGESTDPTLDPTITCPPSSVPPIGPPGSRYVETQAALNELVNTLFASGSPNVRVSLVEFSTNLRRTTALTNVIAQAQDYIAGTSLDGWTCGACGMDGAMSILNSSGPAPATPRPDGAALSQIKQVIFLTDGVQTCAAPGDAFTNVPGTNCGYVENSGEGGLILAEKRPFTDLLQRCDQLKSMGVSVATIAFGVDVQVAGDNQDTLRACASVKPGTTDRQFYLASDYSGLRAALIDVSRTVGRLRITR
ncbi:MAG: VWA domain-containing protein [Rickettsiales bacterium]|nr:VWA domain-containing protein [Rickettsiales bacterium]